MLVENNISEIEIAEKLNAFFSSIVKELNMEMCSSYVCVTPKMIIFHDQKVLSLNFKSSHLRMFFKIDVF